MNELDRIRTRWCLKLFGYVIMPEHVHLVLLPPDGVGHRAFLDIWKNADVEIKILDTARTRLARLTS